MQISMLFLVAALFQGSAVEAQDESHALPSGVMLDDSDAPPGSRSLGLVEYRDPKTTSLKTATPETTAANTTTTATIHAISGLAFPFNSGLAYVFKTDVLARYGTGRVRWDIREEDECDTECEADDSKQLAPQGPCLALTSMRYVKKRRHVPTCAHEHLNCNYPGCKTMVMGDEWCRAGPSFDARMYYTSKWSGMGFLPLGMRVDSWQSLQSIRQSTPQFQVSPLSKRKYAFNAIFSRNTDKTRKAIAQDLEQQSQTSKLPAFVAIAKRWRHDVNNPKTKQISTNDYMMALLDSVFTVSPMGHNPESYRLYEAAEAGSIPIIVRQMSHRCAQAIQSWYDAPVVVLDTWKDLYPTVEGLMADPAKLDAMQVEFKGWYEGYMHKVVADFEEFVLG